MPPKKRQSKGNTTNNKLVKDKKSNDEIILTQSRSTPQRKSIATVGKNKSPRETDKFKSLKETKRKRVINSDRSKAKIVNVEATKKAKKDNSINNNATVFNSEPTGDGGGNRGRFRRRRIRL